MNNYYLEVLGFPPNQLPSEKEIKQNYRKKVKLYHPDSQSPQASEHQFILVTEAYDYLLNYTEYNYEEASQEFYYEETPVEESPIYEETVRYAKMEFVTFEETDFYKDTVLHYFVVLNYVVFLFFLSVSDFLLLKKINLTL